MLAAHRPLGVRLIIAYKLVKAPLVLAAALVLTTDPAGALRAAERVTHDLSEGGALLSLGRHPSASKFFLLLVNAAIVAYLVHVRLRARRAETPG